MLNRRQIIKNSLLGLAALGTTTSCLSEAKSGSAATAPSSASNDSAPRADSVNLKDFGATGDGQTDDWAATQAAVDHCVQNGFALYVPAGRYVLKPSDHANQPIRLDNLTADGQGLKIHGDGPGSSVFVEAPGQTQAIGRYTKMFYFYSGPSGPFGYDAGDYIFEDIGFDKNSGSNPPPPGPYAWEQAHAIAFNGGGTLTTNSVTFNRVGFFNKIGAYINHNGGNVVRRFTVSDVSFGPMAGDAAIWGERGDLELGGTNGVNVVDGVTANFMQIEPVESFKASASHWRRTIIVNSDIATIQFGEPSSLIMGDARYSTVYMNNVICQKQLSLRNVTATIYNSTVNLSNIYNTPGDLKVMNCTVLLDYDAASNAVSPVRIRVPDNTVGGLAQAHFSNCSFDIDSADVAAGASGFAIVGHRKAGNTEEVRVSLDHCRFDSRLQGAVDAYGHGKFNVSNCQLAGHAAGVRAGAYGVYGSDVRLDNNDYSGVAGDWIHIQAHNTLWKLAVSGTYPAAEWRLGQTGSIGIDGYNVKPILQ